MIYSVLALATLSAIVFVQPVSSSNNCKAILMLLHSGKQISIA